MLTPEQIEDRRISGIGASEAAQAVGVSKWGTPLELYFEKLGIVQKEFDDRAQERMRFGSLLEALVADEYVRETGNTVRRHTQKITSKKYPHMFSHIDRRIVGQGRPLECKSAGSFMAGEWGESGSDQYPDNYLIQCHHQMITMEATSCDLAVLIGGNEFRWYTIPFDDELAKGIIAKEHMFWNCVQTKDPPPPTTLDDLALLYPEEVMPQLLGDRNLIRAIQQLATWKAEGKVAEGHIKEWQFTVKEAMGDYAAVVDVDGKVYATWKRNKDGWKFNEKAFKKDNPELWEEYAVEKPGPRVLLIK